MTYRNVRTCKADKCRAPILFAKNQRTGASVVLDAEPNPRGNVVLNDDGTATILTAKQRDEATSVLDPALMRDLYISHYATCADPRRFRR